MSSSSTRINVLQLKLSVKLPARGLVDLGHDYKDEFAFTKEYKFTVDDPNPNPGPSYMTMPLVEVKVRTVDRTLIPPREFHVNMDNVTEDFLQFAVAVFTDNGHIKKSLVSQLSSDCGSGVWGTDINHGKFAYIEILRVSSKYQRQGIVRWAIESALKSPHLADCPFIFTWATHLHTGYNTITTTKPEVIEFWRALGFRRVGGTWFFGYARDPEHPMRSLRATDDVAATQTRGSSSEEVILKHLGMA